MNDSGTIRHDTQAGLTVALVAIPQCMAFATIAGLPPVSGLYAAVVMGLVGAVLASSPKLNIGPAVTTSTMVFAVLATVAPNDPDRWPAIAGVLAILVGSFSVLAAILKVGQFVKFVSRSVLVGLTAGAAILIVGTQIAPSLGVGTAAKSTLIGILWQTLERLDQADIAAVLMAAGTLVFVILGGWVAPRFPTSFLALVLGGGVAWALRGGNLGAGLESVGRISRELPASLSPWYAGPYGTDIIVGAAAICLVGIIQTLAIAKALANRSNATIEPKRELLALGVANLAAGVLHGFPGAGSFARSALNDRAGARTRLSGFIAAIAIALIVLLAAPLAQYITLPAIAGLLIATACSIVDWKEFGHILARRGHDRTVLVIMILCVFIMPIHWAIMVGLAVSVAAFLRRVSKLYLVEMVTSDNHQFQEHPIDEVTGKNAITMLQVEGPLFFAHADEMAETLRGVFRRQPRVTIIRMRRTQQIDFSVIAAVSRVAEEYIGAGGTLIVCGLTPAMRRVLRQSTLGRVVRPEHFLQTTREVFGSAHRAIKLAEQLADDHEVAVRPLFRADSPQSPSAADYAYS
jgi:SulP family sulfate permease